MSKKYSKLARFVNRAFYLGSAAMMLAALVLSVSPMPALAVASPGAIWTTDGSCGLASQDVNHFAVGNHVYINFSNFPAGTYAWQIQQISGNPKPIVASGSYNVGASGAGCFDAHTIQPNEGGHEYSADFGPKNDNYQVDSYTAPTSTNTTVPTATSTLLPTAINTLVPSATATLVPTDKPTDEPTATPETQQPTDEPTATPETQQPTATDEPTATPESGGPTATPETQRPTATDEPAATPESGEPTSTPVTNEPTTTPQVEVTVTNPPRRVPVLEPLSIVIDPFCTVDGQVQWTVENPNNVSLTMYSFTVDGGASQSGFSVQPGETNLTTTALGTHTVEIFYGEAQTESLTYTLAVCPLQIPVTGSAVLIPVTGADLGSQASNGFLMGSLSLAGLGLIFSSLRKFLNM